MKNLLSKPQRKTVVFAIAVAAVAQLADFSSTVFALENGGEEANPIVAKVLEMGGYYLFFFYKLTGIAMFTALTIKSRVFALVLATPFLYISVHNVRIALEVGGF
jgi:hypothetical protein